MKGKNLFWILWLGGIMYAAFLAPPDNFQETFELIKKLSTGEIEGINPLIVSLFNIMGIWPIIYSCVLFFDGRGQKVPAWPFAVLSFGLGAFAILPYLALRNSNPEFAGQKSWFLKIFNSKITAILLLLGSAGLVSWGLVNADWADFIAQWQSKRFIHVMSLDFCALCLLFPALLGDDMARRGIKNNTLFWVVSLIPLFGPLAYLCLRLPVATHSDL
ncbi:MAG TPA: DUF2834 domain-containing protein [Halomicronema sp.]